MLAWEPSFSQVVVLRFDVDNDEFESAGFDDFEEDDKYDDDYGEDDEEEDYDEYEEYEEEFEEEHEEPRRFRERPDWD